MSQRKKEYLCPYHLYMGLKHIPLWNGAAYRIVQSNGTVIPVRLLSGSLRPSPREHTFQHLGTDEEVKVTELSSNNFSLNGERVRVEFA